MVKQECTLTLSNVSVKYGQNSPDGWGLRNLSVDFKSGDRVLVIGLNGSGKSTLLKALSCLVDYDGHISTTGWGQDRTWAQLCEALVTFVPQDIADIAGATVTVREIMQLAPSELFSTNIGHSILAWLEPHSHKFITELSGGERQYLIGALSLCRQAQVYLFDEVFHSLDLSITDRFGDLLDSTIMREEAISIFVSHAPEFVKPYANRVIALKDGQIVFDELLGDETLQLACLHAYGQARNISQQVQH